MAPGDNDLQAETDATAEAVAADSAVAARSSARNSSRVSLRSRNAPSIADVIAPQPGVSVSKDGRTAILQAGAKLFLLPKYSPDLNPIEQVFAKLKHLMRAAEPRDVEATWRKAGQLLDLFSAQECANYLKNSGYRN